MRSLAALAALLLASAPAGAAERVCNDVWCCTNGACTSETEQPDTPAAGRRSGFTLGPVCGFLLPGAAPMSGPGLAPDSLVRVTSGRPLATTSCGGWGMGNLGDQEPFLAINCKATHLNATKPALPLTYAFDQPAGVAVVKGINLWIAGGDSAGKRVVLRSIRPNGAQIAARTITLSKNFAPIEIRTSERIAQLRITKESDATAPCLLGVARIETIRR